MPTRAGGTLTRDELWKQLENAIALRSSEDQVLWTLFSIFWASNAILLVALFTTGTLPKDPTVGVIVAIVGLVLCLAWALLQRRGLRHLIRFEKLMEKVEQLLGIDASLAVSAEINRADYDLYVGRGPRARQVMQACPLAGALLWAAFGAYFVIATAR
ncbi:MAG: hypothetical protein ACHQ01_06075 [Candidatus Limnocylindrales bacterium]